MQMRERPQFERIPRPALFNRIPGRIHTQITVRVGVFALHVPPWAQFQAAMYEFFQFRQRSRRNLLLQYKIEKKPFFFLLFKQKQVYIYYNFFDGFELDRSIFQ